MLSPSSSKFKQSHIYAFKVVQLAHIYSVIAVHGIGAHPDRTWVSNKINWLHNEHMLPAAIPNSRIFAFGYASEWLGKEAINQRLPLVAEQLLRSLMSLRKACHVDSYLNLALFLTYTLKTCVTRPVVFIGHCFGGLVIEKVHLSRAIVFFFGSRYRDCADIYYRLGCHLSQTPRR